MVTYVLDANIIIRLWNDASYVLDIIERHPNCDYIVTNEILLELVNGEVGQFFPVMAPKYQKLVKHMCNSDYAGDGGRTKTPFLVKEIDGQPMVLIGNRISTIDLSTIIFCQNNPTCILVTTDNKMLKNAVCVLGKDHILNYDEFLEHLISRGVITPGHNTRIESGAAGDSESLEK
ncbi:hypothetical protein LLG96_06925 [bacterium]|nr:hypothetical protein [bacterium]